MSNITVAGPVVSSIAPHKDLAPQLERIVAAHLARFTGVPVAVYLVDPRGLHTVAVCGHTIPVVAGWPEDAADWQAGHSVAVVYPGFGGQS